MSCTFVGIGRQISELDGEMSRVTIAPRLVLICGPSGSGKTSLARHCAESNGYTCYWCNHDSYDTESVIKFCSTKGTVGGMISGITKVERRAVIVDDVMSDQKAISRLMDAVRASGSNAVVIVCSYRVSKVPDLKRRSDVVIELSYPTIPESFGYLRSRYGGALADDAILRCAEASRGCIQKAVMLLEGELYGTKAVRTYGADNTMYQDVVDAVRLARTGAGVSSVEEAIHREPFMAFMIVRGAFAGRVPPSVRMATVALSKVSPGTAESDMSAAVAFSTACTSFPDGAEPTEAGALSFPTCYTTSSARATNLRKRADREDASVVRPRARGRPRGKKGAPPPPRAEKGRATAASIENPLSPYGWGGA